jgi:hypothetical protein
MKKIRSVRNRNHCLDCSSQCTLYHQFNSPSSLVPKALGTKAQSCLTGDRFSRARHWLDERFLGEQLQRSQLCTVTYVLLSASWVVGLVRASLESRIGRILVFSTRQCFRYQALLPSTVVANHQTSFIYRFMWASSTWD